MNTRLLIDSEITICHCEKCNPACRYLALCETSAHLKVCVSCALGMHDMSSDYKKHSIEEMDNCKK